MRRLFPLLAVVALARPAHALDPDKPLDRCAVTRWQVKDGLPGDSIRAIAQGSDGQLWIAALGGIARYDGLRFTPVEVAPDWRSAASDVATFLVGRDGSVWGGSARHPPLRFFQGQLTALGPREGLGSDEFHFAMAEDARGELWLASTRGIYRIADGRFIAHAIQDLGGRHPTDLCGDRGGTVWLGTDRGLFSIAGDRLVPHPQVPAGAAVSAIHEDRRRVFWVAAGDDLLAIDGARVTRYGAALGLPRGPYSQIVDDEDGNVWVGSPGGLARVRGGKVALYTAADGLPENDVTALLVDREGSLWVGTRNGGIAQFTDRTLDTQDVPPGLDRLEVQSVCEDSEGGMWFGTRGHGAIRWRNHRATTYTAADGLPGDTANSVLPGRDGEVWIGTPKGLARWRAGKIDDPGLWPRMVVSLFRDHHDGLWIGGAGDLGHAVDGKLVAVLGPEQNVPKQVRAMRDEPDGRLWVSGLGGVFRFEGCRFVRPTPLRDLKLGPARSMLTDAEGTVWLTIERAGLFRVRGGQTTIFAAAQGLDAEMLYQLRADDAGDLWIGTNKSILRVSRASLDAVADGRRSSLDIVSFETTDRRAGVVASLLKQPSAWKSRDGRVWFVTRQGAVTVDPRHLRLDTVPPGIVLEAVRADGRAVTTGVGERHFPAGLGTLELHYAARALLEPSKVRYRYRLEGVDPGWVEAGGRRIASYSNLPPGSYHFRVQASNADQVWNDRSANYTFTIAPPFYRTFWFPAVCALALLPLVLIAHRLRMARLRAQYVVMFAERSRVARELHDTLLQGMSAVAMQLNSIRMRLSGAPEGARRDLELVQDTVTRCLEETRRMVWDLRDRGADGGDLGAALTRFARRATQGTQIECQVSVEGAPAALPHAVEDQLFRIGQEALTNAVKHAKPNKIDVRLHYDPTNVTLTISDDGAGFDPAISPDGDHFGLVGLRERSAAIRATLDLRSAPGQGTTVQVAVHR